MLVFIVYLLSLEINDSIRSLTICNWVVVTAAAAAVVTSFFLFAVDALGRNSFRIFTNTKISHKFSTRFFFSFNPYKWVHGKWYDFNYWIFFFLLFELPFGCHGAKLQNIVFHLLCATICHCTIFAPLLLFIFCVLIFCFSFDRPKSFLIQSFQLIRVCMCNVLNNNLAITGIVFARWLEIFLIFFHLTNEVWFYFIITQSRRNAV